MSFGCAFAGCCGSNKTLNMAHVVGFQRKGFFATSAEYLSSALLTIGVLALIFNRGFPISNPMLSYLTIGLGVGACVSLFVSEKLDGKRFKQIITALMLTAFATVGVLGGFTHYLSTAQVAYSIVGIQLLGSYIRLNTDAELR